MAVGSRFWRRAKPRDLLREELRDDSCPPPRRAIAVVVRGRRPLKKAAREFLKHLRRIGEEFEGMKFTGFHFAGSDFNLTPREYQRTASGRPVPRMALRLSRHRHHER